MIITVTPNEAFTHYPTVLQPKQEFRKITTQLLASGSFTSQAASQADSVRLLRYQRNMSPHTGMLFFKLIESII